MATFQTVTLSLIKSAEAIAGEFIGYKLPNLYQKFDYTCLVDNSTNNKILISIMKIVSSRLLQYKAC
ncbi:hypothetical protein BDY19DRAFT_990584 [Irpex rosettiformis]|uniref:Uncharacterized protein n=1 Tax=Irpex rosettiformis TaxID=378272 RepID=A0ACB8UEZ9_9APHY|nr:hypothetical protein BDY19DRAFT_990584 [Irpex rosettiformis]